MGATLIRSIPFAIVCAWLGGCSNNGWGKVSDRADELCRAAVPLMSMAIKDLDEKGFVDLCVEAATPALQPCTEHKYGSDSAIQCIERYYKPAIEKAMMNDIMTGGMRTKRKGSDRR